MVYSKDGSKKGEIHGIVVVYLKGVQALLMRSEIGGKYSGLSLQVFENGYVVRINKDGNRLFRLDFDIYGRTTVREDPTNRFADIVPGIFLRQTAEEKEEDPLSR